MLVPRLKFVALFGVLFWLGEVIFRLGQRVARPNSPPLDITKEAVQFLVLPALIVVVLAFFPVEEERFPVRSVLIAMAIYLVYAFSLVLGGNPDVLSETVVPILKFTLLTGVWAGLAAFGARKILAAIESGRSASK